MSAGRPGPSGSSLTTGTICGFLAGGAGLAVGVEHRSELGDEVGAHQTQHVAPPRHQRDLGDDGPHPAIESRHHDDVAAAVARPPHPDPIGGDAGELPDVGDRMAVVANLGPRVDLLARLAIARTEVAVVEHERGQPGRGEPLGIGVQVHLLHGREAVRHDDDGHGVIPTVGPVQPSPQRHALGIELDIGSHLSPPHPPSGPPTIMPDVSDERGRPAHRSWLIAPGGRSPSAWSWGAMMGAAMSVPPEPAAEFIEIPAGDGPLAVREGVPRVQLDVHLGPWLPRDPRRAGPRAATGLLLDRCRARRPRGRDDRVRLCGDARPGGLAVPRRRRRATTCSPTRRARTPSSSTAPASSSTVPASQVGPGARCTSPRSPPTSRRSTGSRRCAGSCRSASTGSRCPTGRESATVRRWSRADWGPEGETMAWCCTEEDRDVRRRPAGHRLARRRARGDRRSRGGGRAASSRRWHDIVIWLTGRHGPSPRRSSARAWPSAEVRCRR